MSQSHIREAKKPSQPIVWWPLVLGCGCTLVLSVALLLFVTWMRSQRSTYETTTAEILETRKVIDGMIDSRYGGKILYGGEAHVRYVSDGQVQERWLRISDDLPRESLLTKLAAHPTECRVYWTSGHPENAKCSLK